MKNKIALTFSALILASSSQLTLANPTGLNVSIRCPSPQNQIDMLSNYGNFIAGYGSENIQGQNDTQIYFKSATSIKGIPNNLTTYSNATVEYVSTTGDISCAYTSNDSPPFKLSYTLINGKGGQILSTTNDTVNLVIPFGAKH